MYIFSSYEEYCDFLKNKFKNLNYFLIFLINNISGLFLIISFIVLVLSGLVLAGLPALLIIPLISDISYIQISLPLLYSLIAFILSTIILILSVMILDRKVQNKTEFFDFESYNFNLNNWKKSCIKNLQSDNIIDAIIEKD
jgi:hypothetical protein